MPNARFSDVSRSASPAAHAILGKAIPHGVYDIDSNRAWALVGVSHDIAEFAAEAIRHWLEAIGGETIQEPEVVSQSHFRHG